MGVHRKQYPPPPQKPLSQTLPVTVRVVHPWIPAPLSPPPPPPPPASPQGMRSELWEISGPWLVAPPPPPLQTPIPADLSDAITNFNLPTASITLTVTFATPSSPVAVPARNVWSDVHRNLTGFCRGQRAVVVSETEKEIASSLFKDCISSSSRATLS